MAEPRLEICCFYCDLSMRSVLENVGSFVEFSIFCVFVLFYQGKTVSIVQVRNAL